MIARTQKIRRRCSLLGVMLFSRLQKQWLINCYKTIKENYEDLVPREGMPSVNLLPERKDKNQVKDWFYVEWKNVYLFDYILHVQRLVLKEFLYMEIRQIKPGLFNCGKRPMCWLWTSCAIWNLVFSPTINKLMLCAIFSFYALSIAEIAIEPTKLIAAMQLN